MHPRRSSHTPVPNPHYLGGVEELVWWGHRLSYAELLAAALAGRVPVTYVEAMHSVDKEEWQKVCEYEVATLAKNGMWDLVDIPPGHRPVKSKWVFKMKADGCYHARPRLVAKG